jgi:hypothetical protein
LRGTDSQLLRNTRTIGVLDVHPSASKRRAHENNDLQRAWREM